MRHDGTSPFCHQAGSAARCRHYGRLPPIDGLRSAARDAGCRQRTAQLHLREPAPRYPGWTTDRSGMGHYISSALVRQAVPCLATSGHLASANRTSERTLDWGFGVTQPARKRSASEFDFHIQVEHCRERSFAVVVRCTLIERTGEPRVTTS